MVRAIRGRYPLMLRAAVSVFAHDASLAVRQLDRQVSDRSMVTVCCARPRPKMTCCPATRLTPVFDARCSRTYSAEGLSGG